MNGILVLDSNRVQKHSIDTRLVMNSMFGMGKTFTQICHSCRTEVRRSTILEPLCIVMFPVDIQEPGKTESHFASLRGELEQGGAEAGAAIAKIKGKVVHLAMEAPFSKLPLSLSTKRS